MRNALFVNLLPHLDTLLFHGKSLRMYYYCSCISILMYFAIMACVPAEDAIVAPFKASKLQGRCHCQVRDPIFVRVFEVVKDSECHERRVIFPVRWIVHAGLFEGKFLTSLLSVSRRESQPRSSESLR